MEEENISIPKEVDFWNMECVKISESQQLSELNMVRLHNAKVS